MIKQFGSYVTKKKKEKKGRDKSMNKVEKGKKER